MASTAKPHIRVKSGPIRKVLALNASPRAGRRSTTSLMLGSLVDGMRDAGAEVEVVDLRRMRILPCRGCYDCWTVTPGVCSQKDDMAGLFGMWTEADLAVYATPLYLRSMSTLLKVFIERTLPAFEPWIIVENGYTYHPLRTDLPRCVVLSVCGLANASEFNALSAWAHSYLEETSLVVAEIYRSQAEVLVHPYFRERKSSILDATKQAGAEIIRGQAVAPETLERAQGPIIEDPEVFSRIANIVMGSSLDAHLTPSDYRARGLRPRPRSMEEFVFLTLIALEEDVPPDLTASIRFQFDEGESCTLEIHEGRARVTDSTEADLTIHSPFELWMDIVAGKVEAGRMLMQRRCRAEGDLSLLRMLSTGANT